MNEEIITTTEVITPQIAERWLKFNTRNRPVNKRWVAFLAKEMREGRWVLNGESIKFASDGAIEDGQHRLYAVVESRCTIESFVTYNVNHEKAFPTLGSHLARSLSDVLFIAGNTNTRRSSSIVKHYYTMKVEAKTAISNYGGANTSRLSGKSMPSNGQLHDLYMENKEFFDRIGNDAERCYKKSHILPISIIGGTMAFFVLDRKSPEYVAVRFFEELCDIDKSASTKALSQLKHILNNDKSNKGKKNTSLKRTGLLSKAWNDYIIGGRLKRLTFDEKTEKVEFYEYPFK